MKRLYFYCFSLILVFLFLVSVNNQWPLEEIEYDFEGPDVLIPGYQNIVQYFLKNTTNGEILRLRITPGIWEWDVNKGGFVIPSDSPLTTISGWNEDKRTTTIKYK